MYVQDYLTQERLMCRSGELYDFIWQLCLGVIFGFLTLCKSQDVTLGQQPLPIAQYGFVLFPVVVSRCDP